ERLGGRPSWRPIEERTVSFSLDKGGGALRSISKQRPDRGFPL
ncbi:unnamed protein product, partial [Laminaria digitata]